MKIKKAIKIILVICLLSSLFHASKGASSIDTLSDGYYQESVYDQGVNLTIGVSNTHLEWYMNFTVSLRVRGSADEPIPNSTILLQINTVSIVSFGYNFTLHYYLWNNFEDVSSGSKDIDIYISHVPTQQDYLVTAIFQNQTQIGPNITFTIHIESERTGVISFETFLVAYIGLLIFSGCCIVLFKKNILKISEKKNHDIKKVTSQKE